MTHELQIVAPSPSLRELQTPISGGTKASGALAEKGEGFHAFQGRMNDPAYR